MKIEINIKIFFLIILFFFFGFLNTYIIFLTFIVLHELAHLLFGIYIGGKPKVISINPLGVSLEFYSYGKNKTISKVMLYFIGPLTNLIFALLFAKVNFFEEYREKIIYINLALSSFNLIPIIPLDGGKILLEILKIFVEANVANKCVLFFSKFFLICITLIYSILVLRIKSIFILFLLCYLWILYIKEEKKLELYERLRTNLNLNH